MSWTYNATLYGPTDSRHEWVPAASMLHFRYSVDAARPWFGQGPLHWAHRTGTLAGALETRLGAGSERAGRSRASGSGKMAATGRTTTRSRCSRPTWPGRRGGPSSRKRPSAGLGRGPASGRPDGGLQASKRFGANPPATLPSLRTEAGMSVLSRVRGAGRAGGAGCGWHCAARRMDSLSGGRCRAVARGGRRGSRAQARGSRVRFDLSPLSADLAVRAQALERMVAAGVELAEARRLAGLVATEE